VRVVAGRFGGRTLVAPRGRSTRPTSDRVREALFSILGPGPVGGARVLDLFAGSGAMAIEALSRGASDATLVDSSAASVAHHATPVNTIWCSSILHIAMRAPSEQSSRRRWDRFSRSMPG